MPFLRLRQLVVATLSVALAAGLLPLLAASSAEAAAKPRRFISGWAPYWGMSEALQTIDANDSVFASVNGFWHSATASTTITHSLSNAARADAVAHLHAEHIAVYGTVTDQSGKGHMAAVLRSPSKRLAHVRTLVNLAVANHYDGIDLDYEGFAFHDGRASWDKTRPAWVTFIRQLSASLHAHGKKLAVSTPAIYDAKRGDSSGYWVYDWHGIAPYVDQVRIMAYDFSVSHVGPIAPIAWVNSILKFAVTQIPPSHILLGVPTYGRNWVTSSTASCPANNRPVTVAPTTRQAEALAKEHNAKRAWNATTKERSFTYRKTYTGLTKGKAASCTVTRTVIYDDASAVLARTQLAASYHLVGVSLWALGYDGSGQFSRLNTYARSIAKRTPQVTVSAGDSTYGHLLVVSGHVRSPGGSSVKDMAWRLQWASNTGGWHTVAHGKTSSKGTFSLSRRATASGKYRVLVAGSWWYLSGSSAANQSRVKLAVAAAFASTSVRHKHSVALTGSVAPARKGLLVQRQVRSHGKWLTQASTHTTSKGTFRFSVTPPSKGTYAYRFLVASDGHRTAGAKVLTLHST